MSTQETNNRKMSLILLHVGRTFITGLAAVLPMALIILGIVWLFNLADGLLQPLVRYFFGQTIPGLGIIFTLLLIYFVGLLTSNAIGTNAVRLGEFLVNRLPVISQIYSGAKQAMEAVSIPGSFKGDFRNVVLVEYPRENVFTMGFVTNKVKDLSGANFQTVFLPTSPFPHTGMWILASKDQIFETDISFLEAVEMTISWGVIAPDQITIHQASDLKPMS